MSKNIQKPFDNVTSPTKNRSGILTLSIITLFAVALTVGGTYWLSRDKAEQKAIVQTVQNTVQNVVKDTPLAPVVTSVIDYINKEPVPARVTKPRTTPGTLSGQSIHAQMSPPLGSKQKSTATQSITQIQGKNSQNSQPKPANSKIIDSPNGTVTLTLPTVQVGSIEKTTKAPQKNTEIKQQNRIDEQQKSNINTIGSGSTAQEVTQQSRSVAKQDTPEQNTPEQEQKPITPTRAKVSEDDLVPLPFVDDVATWLVKRYNPKNGTNFSLGLINARYGTGMYRLMPQGKQDVYGSRAQLLRYAFNAPMLKALYGLYAERFVKAMDIAAQKEVQAGKKIVPTKLFSAYANDFHILGDTLRAIGSTTDFDVHMKSYDTASQNVLQIHKEITDAIHNLNIAKEKGKATRAIALQIQELNAKYRRSIQERNSSKENLVSSIRKNISKQNRMDSDSILFVAMWLERRIATGISGENAINNARIAGELLQDLSSKLSQSGKN